MFFGWLRRMARDAVLGGVAEALDELAPPEKEQGPTDLTRLRGLAATEAKALPPAKEAGSDQPEPEQKKGRSR